MPQTITCATSGGRVPYWVQLEVDGSYLQSSDDITFCTTTATNTLSCTYSISATGKFIAVSNSNKGVTVLSHVYMLLRKVIVS